MSQHDFNIANQLFPATRADLNNSLVALASNSSGDAEPSTTYANQWWYETDSNTLKLRNEANTAWVPICILDQGNNNVLSITTQGLTLGATTITASGTEINQLDAITRGSLIYGNASGVTSRLAKGGADTVLTSDGTDIAWAAAAGGGAYNLLQTVTADNSGGSITIGSSSLFSSTYTSYEIIVTDLVLANDTNVVYYLSLNGTLKGKTENAADYFYNGIAVQISSRNPTTAATSRAASNLLYLMQSGSNETGGVSNFRVNISRPSETNTYKIVTHKGAFQANITVTGGIGNVRLIDDAGVWVGSDATTALTAITYETGSGNFVRGTFKLYGIS